MKVDQFMTKNLVTCHGDQTVEEAALAMLDGHFSAMPVIDDNGSLIGLVTESDFVGKNEDIPHALVSMKNLFGQKFHYADAEDIYRKARKRPLKEVMSKTLSTVTSDKSLSEVLDIMRAKKLKRIPVVENGILKGIVTRKDIMKAFSSLD